MEINNENKEYQFAKERVEKIKKFYSNCILFVVLFAAFYGYKIMKYGFPSWPKFQINIIFIVWGIILLIKGIKLFLLNSDWEKDMINKELNNRKDGE